MAWNFVTRPSYLWWRSSVVVRAELQRQSQQWSADRSAIVISEDYELDLSFTGSRPSPADVPKETKFDVPHKSRIRDTKSIVVIGLQHPCHSYH